MCGASLFQTQKQEGNIESLQTELDQTNEELDKLNNGHLEERAQLIHDLQSCEREIDSLKDMMMEKDKEISVLSGNMAEYAEQLTMLKQEIRLKEENLVHVENALSKAEREAMIIRDSQNLDQQALNNRITELLGKLQDAEVELLKANEQREFTEAEVERLLKLTEEDKRSIQDMQGEIQKHIGSHRSHLCECEAHISSLREQLDSSTQKLQESERVQQQLHDKEQTFDKELKSFKEEQNRFLTQEEKYKQEIQTLTKQLEEQIQIKQQIQEKQETVTCLEKQLKANEQQARDVYQKFIGENQKLSVELQSKCENITKLTTDNQQLHEELQGLNKELELQKQNVKELNGCLEKQVGSLTQELERLELKISESEKTKDLFQSKVCALQTQQSQNNQTIQGLQKEKEELLMKLNDLNRVIEQSKHSNAEILLAKTTECVRLNQIRRDKEDQLTRLQEEVQSLTSTMDHLQRDVAEREQAVSDLHVQLEAQRCQQTHLQETVSVLQQQEFHLKSAVGEKDAVIQQMENEITAQRSQLPELQAEAEVLRQQLEEREEHLKTTTQKHKEELNQKKQTVKSLSEQIGVMEEKVRRLESEAELRQTELVSLTEEHQQVVSGLREQLRVALDQNSSLCVKMSSMAEDNHRLQEEVALNTTSLSELSTEKNLLQGQSSHYEKTIKDLLQRKEELTLRADELERVLKESQLSNSAGLLEKTSECANLSRLLRQREEQLQSLELELSPLRVSLSEKDQTVLEQSLQLEAQQKQLMQKAEECSVYQNELSQMQSEVKSLRTQIEQKEQSLKDIRNESQIQKEELNKLGATMERAAAMEAEISELKAALQEVTAENGQLMQEVEQSKAEIVDFKVRVEALNELNTKLKCELQIIVTHLSSTQEEISKLQTAAQDRDVILQERDELLKQQQSFIQQVSQSIAEQETLSTDLQAKEAECESLKEQISHLEESVTKINGSLEVQKAEVELLKKALEEKEKSFQDEASLFKARFVESTELVSQLQNQMQLLSTEREDLRRSAEETRSAFSNLQEKYAANLEDLSQCQKLLRDSRDECQTAVVTVETLRQDLSASHHKLSQIEELNSRLSKEKDEALASHQASVSLLTVEIERLKSQHLQVVAQMNGLTENLEQREMALHAINSQFTAQAKHASQLLSQVHMLQEQNKRLSESKDSFSDENTRLQQEVRKTLTEKEELEQICRQLRSSQEELQLQMERTVSEKESLQAKVSAKGEELSQIKENNEKIEQILQDSEKEWLLVLDREKQDKNLLADQLRSVENEIKSKDGKVNALKQDLDSLQEKLAAAFSAIRQGSDQLSLKESEASASRIQLEKVLASVQEKDYENKVLQQSLQTVECELQKLVAGRSGAASSLQDMIKTLQGSHQAELEDLKHELGRTAALLQETQTSHHEKGQQIALLQDMVEGLQTQLCAASLRVKEAAVELQTKEGQMSCMSLQVSQQKELLAGLSQQLRDKDASIAQVMEAASSERMELSDEKTSLTVQLENTEQAHKASVKRLEDVSQQLEEQMSETTELMRKNDDLKSELATLDTEKDALKKKLQAALLLRKDLLKKVEEYESRQEESQNFKTDLQEVTNRAEAAEKHISVLEKEILALRTQSENLVKQTVMLKTTLNDKEAQLASLSQTLTETNSVVEQLQSSAAESEEGFERERKGFIHKLEKLENEIQSCREELKHKASLAAAVSDLERELTQIRSEKATLQKKAHAALLARKETMKKAQENEKKLAELKDNYSQQTTELNAVQVNFEETVKELEELQKTCLSYVDQLDTLRQIVKERDETMRHLKMSVEKESQWQTKPNEGAMVLNSPQHGVRDKAEENERWVAEPDTDIVSKGNQLYLIQTSQEQRHEKCQMEEREQSDKMTAAVEKSSEVLANQKKLAEKPQQLRDDKDVLNKLRCTDTESLDLLRQEKESGLRLIEELMVEVAALKEQLQQNITETKQDVNREEFCSCSCAENFAIKLKEKEELIAALELQIKMHDVAVERLRTETQELQKAQGDTTQKNIQDHQNRIALLTKKLQAALVSRKDLLKENASLKEEAEKLLTKHKVKVTELFRLKEQNVDLESSVSSLHRDRECIANENRSLSAACDSLKLTIENITQQKQAFSCQLESLKDFQTEELSKWKSEHAELKQEYESLLQAYENVSSEMDKMRQLLEGAKRDREDALRQIHKHDSEMKLLEQQAETTEEEKEILKQEVQRLSREKQQNREEWEEGEEKMRRKLTEIDENHKKVMTDIKQQLEAEICRLKESAEELKRKLNEVLTENNQLAENLQKAHCSLEKKQVESNAHTNSIQLKLDEALRLNNSLTAQIQSQKTELAAQLEINNNKQTNIENDYELQLGQKNNVIKELESIIKQHSRDTVSLNEKVKILEDDKCLLQEELENVQEISDKVKHENEYLETVILKNGEKIDELTESVRVLRSQNLQLSSQLAASKEKNSQIRQEKEEEQLKLVRELEEKLKTVQRGNEGSKNVRKELQELLKEKHQEINQLQQNCIKYQEVILGLESAVKSYQSSCEHLEKDLKKSSETISVLEERSKLVEAELVTHRSLLQEAMEEIGSIRSEKERLAEELSQQSKESAYQVVEETKLTQAFDEKQRQFLLQQQIEELKDVKGKEREKVNELKQQLDSRDLQINTLKREAETNEAKLSALSSTSQGTEATKLWNDLYQKTLHEKDNQLLEQGFVIKRLLEDIRVKDKELNDLRVTETRLERTLSEYSVAAAAQQRQLFVMSASNAELSESVELLAAQVKELSAQVERAEQEKNTVNQQLVDKQDEISLLQLNLRQIEEVNTDAEAQLLLLQSEGDKRQADFEKQEGICLQLKTLVHSKDAEISSLLSCRDGQMSGYLEQLQANYRSQAAVYEDRLTSSSRQRDKADEELRGLEAKVKGLQLKLNKCVQEKQQVAARVEALKSSVASFQSERERLVSEYRMLEAKSELGLKAKGSAGEGGPAKGLKHEIRKLLHQIDDLNSENAMLRAQLVRYREDLNQVLSLKDNQLKTLLKKQQEVIKNLENQKAAAEKQHRDSRLELHNEVETSTKLKAENSKLKVQVEMLSKHQERVISDLQEAVATKAAECYDLQQKLLCQKGLTDGVMEKLNKLESETSAKLAEAEEKHKRKLDAFEREVELMRNGCETADQRLAELAKDLLETEQQLSEAKTQNKSTKAQNESLCKAMAALQDDRDQLIEDFKSLRNQYDDELRETQAAFNKAERSLQDATSDLAALTKERDILSVKLKAVQSRDAHTELSRLLEELSKALVAKEKELKQVVLENSTFSRQLSSFSRSMASLQNDRDRLMDELVGVKRAGESSQTLTVSSDGPVSQTSCSLFSCCRASRVLGCHCLL